MDKKRTIKSIVIIAAFAAAGIYVVSTVDTNATATIVYPRFGSPIRGPFSPGPGLNTTTYLEEPITVWVAPEPSSSPIPAQWLEKANWYVALLPAVIPNVNCTPLLVENVFTGKNQLVLFGGGLDVNPTIPTALGITCRIPADVVPVIHNLAIGFKTPITPARQKDGSVNLTPAIGSWRGPPGSASSNIITGNSPFLLVERNAVSIPWIHDARSSGGLITTPGGKAVKPFTIMHVTDTHYYADNPNWLGNNSLWEADSQVIAPDVIVLSGDLMEGPGDEEAGSAAQYDMAYSRVSALGLPIVLVSGNHDNRNLGLWKHYFGPLNSVTWFDDVKIVGFDNYMPVGSSTLNWIASEATPIVPGAPVFLTCHYNIDPSYFQSGWIGIGDLMVDKNLTGILVGHTHSDLVGSVGKLRDAIFNNVNTLVEGGEDEYMAILTSVLETTNATTSYLRPIQEPQILMTRTAAKNGDTIVPVGNFTNAQLRYSGYRLIDVSTNHASNYTYDLDGDGVRDPQVCFPVGMFRVSLVDDAGLGSLNSSGSTWTMNNTGNEALRAARATFLLPNAPAGHHWALNQTFGDGADAYIRAQVTNGTHWWIDARVPAARRSVVSLRIEPASGCR
ncbi:MAG: metallophosphoesterase [Candidatus Lokiarchaeota archaeon]|nr:metallophosphoesterase [Candidatus Lokiarchaeota archaeon]